MICGRTENKPAVAETNGSMTTVVEKDGTPFEPEGIIHEKEAEGTEPEPQSKEEDIAPKERDAPRP